jgi:hypothetical protein
MLQADRGRDVSRHRLALGGSIAAIALMLPAPAGAATIAGQELGSGASALVQGFCGDPGAGGSVTYSASGTLGAGSISVGGSAEVNGAGEVTSFGGSFIVVGPSPDISLGTGTLSLGAPTAASGSCGPPGLTITGGSYSVMLITPNGLETDSGLFDLTATATGVALHFYQPPPSDTTAPVIVPSVSGPLGTNGWYVGDVTVTWSVTDPESDVPSTTGCGPTTISSDTSGTTLTCSATNGAGLSSSASVTIRRDAAPPTIVHVVFPVSPDGTNGWYKTAPIVTFVCEDAISGIASCLADGESGASKTLGESAAPQNVPGTATDNAGNQAHDSATGLLVDLSDPNITCPAPFDVTLGSTMTPAVDVADAVSGLATKSVGTIESEEVGANVFRVDAIDRAGRARQTFCGYFVVYSFEGFSARPGPHQAGSTINLHFGLGANRGLDIFRPGYPRTVAADCTTGIPLGDPRAVDAPGESVTFDLGAARFEYEVRIKTDKEWAGSCRSLELGLKDGSTHDLPLQFR